jgi:ribose transport system permease protein
VWIAIAVVAGVLLLHRSRFGLHLFATGGNIENSRLNGVKTQRVIVLAYVLCSLFACFTGLFLAGRLSSGDPKVGAVFSLDSVTAVALGGISLAGGIGSAAGAIIGSLLVGMISNTMNLINVSAFVQSVIKGLLLLAVVTVQRRKQIGL